MNLLNVSFGIYAFMPQGWFFMVMIIFIECLIMSRLMTRGWTDAKIFRVTILSNTVSGLFGIITSMILNGGWYLVVWMPWISNNEINIKKRDDFYGLIFLYALAFVFTLIIETIINLWRLHKLYSKVKILKVTFITNCISYLVGSVALYSYSFS